MKKVLVWGMGKSGRSAVELLQSKGIDVIFGDDKESIPWQELLSGVDTVVLSPGVPPSHPLWRTAEEKGIEVIGELELSWRFFKGMAIAITGTDGKSTTTHLTYLILKEAFANVEEGGNIGVPFSAVVKDNPHCMVVLEVSSFQGKTLRTFRPSVGAFLNFSQDHLDWHPNVEDYLRSKQNIFSQQTKEDLLIINGAQEEVRNTPSRARKLFFCDGCELRIYKGKGLYKDVELFETEKLKIHGRHNYYNALVSSAIAYSLGVDVDIIKEVLYSFTGLPYRMEFMGEFRGVKVYNDSKSTTPNALRSALESMLEGRVILIAGGKDKGLDFTGLYPLVKDKVKLAILIGESRLKMTSSWRGAVQMVYADSLEEAVEQAFKEAQEGDVILFSPGCASFDMFTDYKERGERFKKAVLDVVKSI